MKIISIITLTLVTAVFLLSYSAPSYSASFYKCPISYSFQTNGNDSARCFKAERKNFRAPKKCPNVHIPVINKSIGHFLKIDYQGNSDKCVGTFKVGPVSNSNAIALGCPTGYRLEVRRGAERCYKTIPAKSIAPSKRVTR